MKKNILLTILALCFSVIAIAQSPIGTWKTIDDKTGETKSWVEIYEKDGKLRGKVVKLLTRPDDYRCTDCEGSRKNQLVLGMDILWDMEKDDDEWEDGTILDPKDGTTYDCKLWLDEDDPNKLYVRGYVLFFFRTQNWYRVK